VKVLAPERGFRQRAYPQPVEEQPDPWWADNDLLDEVPGETPERGSLIACVLGWIAKLPEIGGPPRCHMCPAVAVNRLGLCAQCADLVLGHADGRDSWRNS
jgi:hypothetical protein